MPFAKWIGHVTSGTCPAARSLERKVWWGDGLRKEEIIMEPRKMPANELGLKPEPIRIITSSDRVELLLSAFKTQLGADFAAYRGHVYRILSYAMHFLDDDEELRALIETIFVYHDIGLWTARDLAYLEPSETLALSDNERLGWGFDPSALRDAIHWHHKIFPYQGPNRRIVDAVRKADWIDASGGALRKGLTRAQVRAVEAAIPNYDFGVVLQRLAGELGGNRLAGNARVLRRVFKW
jgi:hypothetical protein